MHPFRAWREANDINIAEAADALGISGAQLSRVEVYKRRPSDALAVRMEEFSQGRVTAGEILGPYLPDGYSLVKQSAPLRELGQRAGDAPR